MTARRSGRRRQAARLTCLRNAHGICGLCGHPGATTLGHIIPLAHRPDLEWNPANHQAQHGPKAGNPGGCTIEGCSCPGNYGLRDRTPAPQPSRSW